MCQASWSNADPRIVRFTLTATALLTVRLILTSSLETAVSIPQIRLTVVMRCGIDHACEAVAAGCDHSGPYCVAVAPGARRPLHGLHPFRGCSNLPGAPQETAVSPTDASRDALQ